MKPPVGRIDARRLEVLGCGRGPSDDRHENPQAERVVDVWTYGNKSIGFDGVSGDSGARIGSYSIFTKTIRDTAPSSGESQPPSEKGPLP
jgi:hypothetical protein